MQPIHILAVGKLKESWLEAACAEYIKRLGGVDRVSVVEVPEERIPREPARSQVFTALKKEGERLWAKIPPRAYIVALCVEGEQMSSEKFSGVLESAAHHYPGLTFLIGSSHGLDKPVKEQAHLRLSLSHMTLPHQLARVVLLEQLYRAASIQGGGKYHK